MKEKWERSESAVSFIDRAHGSELDCMAVWRRRDGADGLAGNHPFWQQAFRNDFCIAPSTIEWMGYETLVAFERHTYVVYVCRRLGAGVSDLQHVPQIAFDKQAHTTHMSGITSNAH